MEIHIHGSGTKKAVLLHGMASTSHTWARLVKDLVKLDYTVYTPDLPGHGASQRGASFYTVEHWQKVLTEKLENADLLVGHSIGGLLALKSRLQLLAEKTVVIDPVLKFPVGMLTRVTQDIWSSVQFKSMKKSAGSLEAANLIWDRNAVRALVSPKGIPMPDSSVLLLRPANSFVAPLALTKKAPEMKVVTMKKVGHNLHGENYPGFFNELKNFALS